LDIPSLHTFALPRVSHRKTLITNKYFPLIIKIIFRTVIVAGCKSTIKFILLGLRYTRVYLCYCSDRVLQNGDFFLVCYFVEVVGLHCCLLYQMITKLRTAPYWVLTQGVEVIYYRSFRTKFRSLLEWPRIQSCIGFHSQKNCIQTTSWPLKMRPTTCPETSVKKCHSSLFNKAVQGSPHLFRDGMLKSRIVKRLQVNSHTFLFLQHNIYLAYAYTINM
jgi:hypothetical protein